MRTRYFALIAGLLYLVIGILGFVPALKTTPVDPPPLEVRENFGLLFGLFPVNVLHNVVHFLLGIWGIMAYRSFIAARWYAGSLATIYAIFAIMGFFPVLNTVWGLVPLYGHDIWLHAVTAVIAAYFASLPAPSPAAADYSLHR